MSRRWLGLAAHAPHQAVVVPLCHIQVPPAAASNLCGSAHPLVQIVIFECQLLPLDQLDDFGRYNGDLLKNDTLTPLPLPFRPYPLPHA